jgi:hypothetical protein
MISKQIPDPHQNDASVGASATIFFAVPQIRTYLCLAEPDMEIN